VTVVLEDPAAEHQIRIANRDGSQITLSCTCRARSWRWGHGGTFLRYEEIEARKVFPAADAIAAWRAWHAERGVSV
jgi:hypothetical protein